MRVRTGKNDPIYKAHSYHTKVPHLAIVPSILHYTEPGDVVLDGFCGAGMTGVAAQWCDAAPEDYRRKIEANFEKQGDKNPEWGARSVILNDLSPAGTFIAANYNLPFDSQDFDKTGRRILDEIEREIGWMYETLHADRERKGQIEYTVWSEVFTCPDCSGEVVFSDEALDDETKRVKDSFPCPHCASELTKSRIERCYETRFDSALKTTIRVPKRKPVLISYRLGKTRYEKVPDQFDLSIIQRIESMPLPQKLPTIKIPPMHMTHERARMDRAGVTYVHHFFIYRSSFALSAFFQKAASLDDKRIASALVLIAQHQFQNASIMNRYRPASTFGNAPLGGVYYVPSQIAEANVIRLISGSMKRVGRMAKAGWTRLGPLPRNVLISTHSTTEGYGLSGDSVDYVFTDPPFGENIYYADLNFLIESWHRVLTNAFPEAIIDRFKKKGLPEYQHLMERCFENYYHVLKPGRWMTVVFHNSRNAVWNAIQEAMQAAGFVVADVRTLDKQQGSYRQVTSTAVKQDLVISAYKPNGGLEERFKLKAGSEEGAWDFVRTHLAQLPVFVSKNGQVETLAERQDFLLFDRMVAFHVQRGVTVPLSAAEFYEGLAQRFPERDGMYFLPDQVAEYDKKRMKAKEVLQLDLFVRDEASAIEWLRQRLKEKPQSFQEIHPQFMREIGGWEKYEKPLELSELLAQNFLRYDGKGEVASQIHSYLSTNFKDLRNLPKDAPTLRVKAKDRWYVPDPRKAGDIEKLRERALLKEFWEYLPPGYEPAIKTESPNGYLPGLEPKPAAVPKGKKMKVIRLEAVRAGFKHCWQNRDYRTIIAVAQRIPENVLQEDQKLLMWYDQAVTRTGEGENR